METNNICIRKAQFADMDNIFWLLHSVSLAWNMEQIKTELDNIYVMTCKDKLIGAACCKSIDSPNEIRWIAVHPMYPEKAMSDILHNSLTNRRYLFNAPKYEFLLF